MRRKSLIILALLMLSSIPLAQAQFSLASWNYPDEYGQGIRFFEVYENSTGSWVKVGGNYDYDETIIYDWNTSVAIKLRCWADFNSTLTGASTTTEGKNYLRHNVTVVNSYDTTVFSQQNFTYYDVLTEGAPIWLYAYDVVLDFLTESGEVYTATVTYEVFWSGEWHLVNTAILDFDMDGWNVVNIAILKFVVELDMTSLNWSLIFLGLVMIPASALYFVKGRREELSMDKLFFTLVIFFVGWAVFIGGIMP